MEAHPRRPFVAFKNLGDLGKRAIGGVAQRHDLGIGRWQLCDGVGQKPPEIGSLGQLIGQRVLGDGLETRRSVVIARLWRGEWDRSPPPDDVDAAVPRDAKKPRRDGLIDIELAEVAVQLDECFLGDILGVLGVTEHAQRKVVDRPLVTSNECLERGRVATTGRKDLLTFK